MFYSVGLDRTRMLRMKHWEVVELLRSFRVQKARDVLQLSESVAIGSGTITDDYEREKVMKRLSLAAGFVEPPKPSNTPWTKDLVEYGQQTYL